MARIHAACTSSLVLPATLSACLFSPDLPPFGATSESTGGGTSDPGSTSDPDNTSAAPTTGGAGTSVGSDTSGSTGDWHSPPAPPTLMLSFAQTKQFQFTWSVGLDVSHSLLLERARPGTEFAPLGGVGEKSLSLTMPLHLRSRAAYVLRACNDAGCTDSSVVDIADSLASAIGYFKASNTESHDNFGRHVVLSADGQTLVVAAPLEDGDGSGEGNNAVQTAGAVYVFSLKGGEWSQTAYLKASDPGSDDYFGESLALSDDGDLLAVGAPLEDGPDDIPIRSGAVYVFSRVDGLWDPAPVHLRAPEAESHDDFGSAVALSGNGLVLAVGAEQKAFLTGAVYVFRRASATDDWPSQPEPALKAANAEMVDQFGNALALSNNGDTLAVGAFREASGSIDDPGDNSVPNAGAVYVFSFTGDGWSQQYVKPPLPSENQSFGWRVALSSSGQRLAVGTSKNGVYVYDRTVDAWWLEPHFLSPPEANTATAFGSSVALSPDGETLVVGAPYEDSAAQGIGGDGSDNSLSNAGSVYVFRSSGQEWPLEAYVKAPNPGAGDFFGGSLALSADASTLAIGAHGEGGSGVGINPDQNSRSAEAAGAVYLY